MGLKRFLWVVLLAALSGVALIVASKAAPGENVGTYSRVLLGLLLVLVVACAISLKLLGTRHREAVEKTWLVVVSTVLTYVICDFLLGTLLLPNYSTSAVPDAIVHHRNLPNVTSMGASPEFDITYSTNDLGLRGKNVTLQKPRGVCRILVTGDSFAFGMGVRDDQTYPAMLERALNEGGTSNVQVLNAGVQSYSPVLEYLFLKTYAVHWAPNLVVLAFDQGDLIQEEYYRGLALFDKNGVPLSVDGNRDYQLARPQRMLVRWVASHMLFGSWVVRAAIRSRPEHETFDAVVQRANRELLLHTLKDHAHDYSKAWGNVFESIKLAFRLSRESGSGFVLVAYPWGHQVGEHEWSTGRQQFLPQKFEVSDQGLEDMRRFAAREGIPFLDLFPSFREYTGKAEALLRCRYALDAGRA